MGVLSQNKDETQDTFINFAKEAQRQHDCEIKAIRSDNGTEFKNYTMDEFLSDEGIKHQYVVAYTPQQNGVAERKNWTLIEMARTMLDEYKSPYKLWAEAINTACVTPPKLIMHYSCTHCARSRSRTHGLISHSTTLRHNLT